MALPGELEGTLAINTLGRHSPSAISCSRWRTISAGLCLVVLAVTTVEPVRADAASDAATRNREVSALFTAGDLRGAYTLGETTLAENRSDLGSNHPEVARSLYYLGVMNQQRGHIKANTSCSDDGNSLTGHDFSANDINV